MKTIYFPYSSSHEIENREKKRNNRERSILHELFDQETQEVHVYDKRSFIRDIYQINMQSFWKLGRILDSSIGKTTAWILEYMGSSLVLIL